MIPIILYGNDKDLSINSAVKRILKAGKAYGKIEDCCVFDYNECDISSFENTKGIFIFKSNLQFQDNIIIPSGFLAILPSYSCNAASILKNINVFAVTCGTSSRDTISLSSLNNLRAVISLQRNVRSVDGELILPHEIVVDLNEQIAIYPLLASIAVLVLCNSSEANCVYKI